MSEDFDKLCEEYLSALDSDVDEERLSSLQSEISDLKDEKDQYISDYGEEDVLVERVTEEIEELEKEKEEYAGALNETEELKEQILNRTKENYVATGEYTKEPSLEALNHIFTGSRDPLLQIEDWTITPEMDLEEGLRQCSDYIRKMALAKLDQDDTLLDTFEKIEGTKKYEPFILLAEADKSLSPSQVADRLDEDVETDTVGTRFRNAIHGLEYNPYHRKEGDYTLSTVGELIYELYSDDVMTESSGENESEKGGGQVSLTKGGEMDE
jgi:myosin heavy subunit